MLKLGTKELETERLILRRLTVKDAEIAFKNWCNSDIVDKYVLWKKHEDIGVTRKQYQKWEEEYEDLNTYRWIVELKSNHDLIGTIDVATKFLRFGACEIGYCYGDKFWNKGYATESIKAVIKYLFEECGADTIFAEHMINNPASGKVMEKAGMKFEGVLKSRVIDKENKRNDLVSYAITREDYFINNHKR